MLAQTVSARWLLTAIGIAIPRRGFLRLGRAVPPLLARELATALPPGVGGCANAFERGPGLRCGGIRRLRNRHAAVARLVDSRCEREFAGTVLYLHGQNGNLGDTVDALARLHGAGVNVLAFDYRGYGQSQFVRPSEAHWREDAESALDYLTGTRHVDPGPLSLDGTGWARTWRSKWPPRIRSWREWLWSRRWMRRSNAIFTDARARLVPARWLVGDRYDHDAR